MGLLRSLCSIGLCAAVTLGAQSAGAAEFTPFISGSVDGHAAEVILVMGGGSGGAFSADVFVDAGMYGVVETNVSVVDGSGLSAFFDHGKLYFINAIHLPGECEACSRATAAQQFSFNGQKLEREDVLSVIDAGTKGDPRPSIEQAVLKAFRSKASR
jgi:hypothetical protein